MEVKHTVPSKKEAESSSDMLKHIDIPKIFTVWQKSSMGFQGTDGFSVYDNSGRLVFRVDNYARRQRYLTKEIVLMDVDGKAFLCLRPRLLSLHDRWNAYEVEEWGNKQPNSKLFSMKRYSNLRNIDKTQVLLSNLANNDKPKLMPGFSIEGCFKKRSCKIFNSRGEEVAQISRKTSDTSLLLGNDVFRLVIRPGVDCKMVMAFVIVMDQIN